MSYLKGRNLGSNKTFDLVTIGQASLDIINNDLGISTELLGGAAVYVAAIASSLKLRTGLVTNIGYDFNPDFLNLLKGTGVDFTGVHQKPGPSSRINLYYHGDYKKNITVFEGVGSSLSVMDLPSEYVSTRIIHITPAPYQTQISVAEHMRKQDILVSFDPHSEFNNHSFSKIKKIISNVDIFIANESETLAITDELDLNSATARIQDAGPPLVIITRGSNGAVITYGSDKIVVPPLKPLKAIKDYVGAGDAFLAGFLAGLSNAMSLSSCGLLGAATAACIIQEFGLKYIPTVEAVHEILASNRVSIEEWPK